MDRPLRTPPESADAVAISEPLRLDQPSVNPPPGAHPSTFHRPLVAGQLATGWQIMLGVAWAAVFFAFAATWKASEEIGIATWWLGPRAQPQPVLVKMIPFALCVTIALLAIYNIRHVARVSVAAALLIAVVAVPDMSRSGGLAAIEFAIAGAALLISLGALTGTYRPGQLVPGTS